MNLFFVSFKEIDWFNFTVKFSPIFFFRKVVLNTLASSWRKRVKSTADERKAKEFQRIYIYIDISRYKDMLSAIKYILAV